MKKHTRFGFKIEGPSGEKENVMVKSSKLKAILLLPTTYQFYRERTATRRYGQWHRRLAHQGEWVWCDLTQRVTLGLARSRTIVEHVTLTSRKLISSLTHFYLLNYFPISFFQSHSLKNVPWSMPLGFLLGGACYQLIKKEIVFNDMS